MAFYPIQQGNTSTPLRFLLVLSSDHITGATGVTPTVRLAKNDGLGFIVPAGAVSEVGQGWYQVAPNATDANTLGPLTLHATANNCDPTDEEFVVVSYNPTSVTIQPSPSSSAITVAEFLTRVLRLMGVYGAGETPSAEDMADAFLFLNEFLDGLGTERLSAYTIARTTFTLTSTKGTPTNPYTVGPSGDIAIARPESMEWIEELRYQDTTTTPTTEYRLTPLSRAGYDALPQKTLTNTLPSAWFYEPTFPTGSLYLSLIPTQSNLQGVLYAPTPISQFGATTDLMSFPPGYMRFLRANLAIEMWASFRENVPLDPSLVQIAQESKTRIKLANVRMTDLVSDAALTFGRRPYSILWDGPA